MAKGGKVDVRELERFAKKIANFQKNEIDAFCRECAKELAARFLAKVKPRTPVGVKPTPVVKTVEVKGEKGKSRSFLSSDAARIETYWKGYHGGTLRRNWFVDFKIDKSGYDYKIGVHNDTEYASYVEYGHRQTPGRYVPAIGKSLKNGWVPGKFMMSISEKEIQNITPALMEKRIQEKLGELLK